MQNHEFLLGVFDDDDFDAAIGGHVLGGLGFVGGEGGDVHGFLGDAFFGEVEEHSAGAGGAQVVVVIPAGVFDGCGIGVSFDAQLFAGVFLSEDADNFVE